MNAYKIELFVLDFADYTKEKELINDIHYLLDSGDLISEIKLIGKKDLGEWTDEHPLNQLDDNQAYEEYMSDVKMREV